MQMNRDEKIQAATRCNCADATNSICVQLSRVVHDMFRIWTLSPDADRRVPVVIVGLSGRAGWQGCRPKVQTFE